MTVVDEIKQAISNLSLSERGELERWLHGWTDDAWDRQISKDAATGKLDGLIAEADDEVRTGRLRKMP